jgi:anhydro-N-acetylmuramic acid kinase
MQIIGLISGTSVDGIDSVLVEITENIDSNYPYSPIKLIQGKTFPYPPQLKAEILAVCGGASRSISQICELDDAIAQAFGEVANKLIDSAPIRPALIASHGQTVFHRPPNSQSSISKMGYSVQLGRGAIIAQMTGVETISDFRTADIEAGGQGAPMVSMLDKLYLSDPHKNTIVQNIGGISNLTYLPKTGDQVFGFDNAPGNVLMDMASHRLFGVDFDSNGELASQGKPDLELINSWLRQDFFLMPPPKSTGRELFCPRYLEQILSQCLHLSGFDVLATLTEFTAQAIAQSYRLFLPIFPDRVLICGGGYRNLHLMQRLEVLLAPAEVMSTNQFGIDPDFKEAIAFALLGYLTSQGKFGNLPQVTGAMEPRILGKISLPYFSPDQD